MAQNFCKDSKTVLKMEIQHTVHNLWDSCIYVNTSILLQKFVDNVFFNPYGQLHKKHLPIKFQIKPKIFKKKL